MRFGNCIIVALAIVFAMPTVRAAAAADPPFAVTIKIDVSKIIGQLPPIWRFFGYDEGNYTYMKDGRRLLTEIGQHNTPRDVKAAPQVFIRCHRLLTSGDGSPSLKWGSTGVYTEDADGKSI